MDDIRTILKLAARRLEASAFLSRLHWTAIILASIGLMLMIADRLPAEAFLPWPVLVPALAVLAIGIALAMWWPRRLTDDQVAIQVDERLELKDKLSTALLVREQDDPFAQAAVADAVATAGDPRVRETARRKFTVTPPGGWWVSPLIVLATIMLSFLAPLDLFSDEEPDELAVATATRGEVNQSVEAVVKSIQEQPLLNKQLEDMLAQMADQQTDNEAIRSPEDVRRQAIKEVTELNRALDEIVNGEQGKTAKALEKSLSKLNKPQDGEARELADALARADFKSAQDALQSMIEKASTDMTEEEREKLAEQLKQLAEQLEQLAQQQGQLEEALKQAGLDSQLAKNPQALQQAIQNNENLTDQQKQQLQQMAQAQQAASKACQGMGQGMNQLAQQMAQMGQPGQQGGQMGQGMGQQLSQLEQMEMMLQQAQAAANMTQSQCQGLGQGLSMQQTPGNGAFGQGGGQGQGGKAPIAPTPTRTKIIKAETILQEGDIIARQLFDGPQVRGESTARLKQVMTEAMEGWEEAINEDQLPRRYHEAQMHYFGELEKLNETLRDTAPASTTEPSNPEATEQQSAETSEPAKSGG